MSAAARRRTGVLVVVVTTCLAVAAGVLVLVVRDDRDATTGTTATDIHAGHGMGHGGPVMAGCEDVVGTMMMLSPSSADALLDGSCPWPYDTAIAVDGGREDPAIAAPFEPRRYQELFDLAAAARFGVCNVGRLPDPVRDGFVFGFTIDVRSGSCADGPATTSLVAREYATRAWRDANAHRAAESGAPTLVLGRWVVVLEGDQAVVAEAGRRLEALGAVTVS